MRTRVIVFLLGLALVSTSLPAAPTAAVHPVAVRVELIDRAADLSRWHAMDLDVDGVFDGWARIYLHPKQRLELERLGYTISSLPDEGKAGLARLSIEGVARNEGSGRVPALYHTYDTLTSDLQAIAADHTDIVRLSSLGQSIQGRELWMVQITKNPDVEEDEPAVAYISSMHGDEVTGKELCFNLINHLTDNYGTDPRVTDLIDNTEIWILPSMNPDGTQAGQRGNANGVDLNRDFPDHYDDPVNTAAGRQQETGLVMAWTAAHTIALSANFHGGALLVNYPWDNNPTNTSGLFSPTPDPDQDVFYSVSRSYADPNPPLSASASFPNGVTNGAEWYVAIGGMQDWNYAWYGNYQVTIEVSSTKWPPASQLPQFWAENQESMLAYFERVHEGLRGVVTDAVSGAPVAAEVRIDSNPFPSYTDPEVGDWHRIVLPGSYSIEISAVGYASQTLPVTVTTGGATRYDVALQPLPTLLQHAGSRVEDGDDGWLDPGESADLAVSLTNLGKSATGVSATLVPTGWFAEPTRKEATYPDIAVAQTVESDAPYYEVAVDPAIPLGHKAGFALQWRTAEGETGTSDPFFVDVGGPWCQTVSAVDVPQPINDNQTTTSLITASTGQTLTDIRVPVDIQHSYIGDLVVSLRSPEGTSVSLHNRGGGSSSDIVGTYGADLTPVGSLSAFVGESADGVWELSIVDRANGDTGSVKAWSVELCEEPVEAQTPEMRFRELEPRPAGVLISWWPYPGVTSYKVYRATDPSSPGNFVDVTAEDADPTDTEFLDTSAGTAFYRVTGVGPQGEGP